MTRSGLAPRDRGQSVSINYTLSLIIVTMLISGLFISMSDYLESERENVTKSELEVLGNRIAADIATTDRLARSAEGESRVEIATTIPSQVAGTQYDVAVTSSPGGGSQYLVEIGLRATSVEAAVTVTTTTRISVDDSTLRGGAYRTVYDSGSIEVTNG